LENTEIRQTQGGVDGTNYDKAREWGGGTPTALVFQNCVITKKKDARNLV